MRFGFLSECETPPGTTHHRRYWEVMNEVVLAEEFAEPLVTWTHKAPSLFGVKPAESQQGSEGRG